MISLSTAENALKSVYLQVLRNQLDCNIDPILAKIEKTSRDVYGKEIHTILPSTKQDEVLIAKLDLQNLFGYIEITDKSIRASQNSAGAFVELLNAEVEFMLRVLSNSIKNAFYSEDLPSDYLTDKEKQEYKPILISGLKELFSDSATLYGLERDKHWQLVPMSATIDKFDIIEIQKVLDEYDYEFNFMVCSRSTARKYMDYMLSRNQNIEYIDLGGCGKFKVFNGVIPIVPANVPDNEIYFINTPDFAMHQLCDWEWLTDSEGRVLKQVVSRPLYNAMLVKYANIICKKPYKQLKITVKGN